MLLVGLLYRTSLQVVMWKPISASYEFLSMFDSFEA